MQLKYSYKNHQINNSKYFWDCDKINQMDDNTGIFDGVIPDITGDGKADLLDATMYNEFLFDAEDNEYKPKSKKDKTQKHCDNLALIISSAIAAVGFIALICAFIFTHF